MTGENKKTALQNFVELNFPSLKQVDLKNKKNADKVDDKEIILAIKAIFYFLRNQHQKLLQRHLSSIHFTYQNKSQELNKFWPEPKKLNHVQALDDPALMSLKGQLPALLDSIKQENFCILLLASLKDDKISLPSPFSQKMAYCQESYEVKGSLNCLRFTDGRQSFFLMQIVTSADGFYFPEENILISIAPIVNETHVQALKAKLLQDFPKIIRYAQANNSCAGIIASHSRPYHFYYNIWPTLYELANKPGMSDNIPSVIMRKDHDFASANLLFSKSACLTLESEALDLLAISEHKWFIHVGTRCSLRNRYFFEQVDRAFVKDALNSPSLTALQKRKHLEACHPIVWIGVEGQKRCWLQQIEGYPYLLNQLNSKYPQLGVIFDGWTLPLTPSHNSLKDVEKDHQVVAKIVSQLNAGIKYVSVVGETSLTKLNVGDKADFFICNFATGSMHISRFLGKPGFGHLSNKFVDISLRLGMHIHSNKKVYLLPKPYVTDEEKDIRHDYVSYSIDKRAFYGFIEAKLDKVMGSRSNNRINIFIEPPYCVGMEIRQHIKSAGHGNFIQVFPGKKQPNKITGLSAYSESYLKNNLIYDSVSFCNHKKIFATANYLIWLRKPLQRLYCHAMQLAIANSQDNKSDSSAMTAILTSGRHKALDNYLTRMVCNSDPPFGECSEAMLKQAIENLKNEFTFIGLEEKQSQSFDLLCATMDWDRSVFPDQIKNKFYVDFSSLDDETRRLACTLISFDARLYQAAESIFEERLHHYETAHNIGGLHQKNRPKWFNFFRK